MNNTIELIASRAEDTPATALNVLKIANDSDVSAHSQEISSAEVVELHFPAFSDGRAFSQAVQLRKRLGFKGDIRATGDVLVDQLVQMLRSGFSSAVLREDQSLKHATKLLSHYKDFYQGDVTNPAAFLTGKLA
ncbi:DUF934 domain-containing protein [Variovorax sp. PCZ-1]|uniref:DUF934 domain-containing protein n=1 Tax=Variovorax sp. PCZ-1 TaxID=2835533 RepID=UPI001BD037B5|nr:DUF934 domain-containing protein [Variovorax sp. PCZ-1]MBS7806841.1 DUF934 domain-containing protein [Variovorax sp. PCZ-1]